MCMDISVIYNPPPTTTTAKITNLVDKYFKFIFPGDQIFCDLSDSPHWMPINVIQTYLYVCVGSSLCDWRVGYSHCKWSSVAWIPCWSPLGVILSLIEKAYLVVKSLFGVHVWVCDLFHFHQAINYFWFNVEKCQSSQIGSTTATDLCFFLTLKQM